MKVKKRVVLQIEVDENVTTEYLTDYVTKAVKSYGGGLHPDEPMFGHHEVTDVYCEATGKEVDDDLD